MLSSRSKRNTKFSTMLYIKILPLLLISSGCEVRAQYAPNQTSSSGDELSVTVIFNSDSCKKLNALSYKETTITEAATWVTERINFLEVLSPLRLSLAVRHSCSEVEFLKTIFEVFESPTYSLGVAVINQPSDRAAKFSELLGVKMRRRRQLNGYLVKATVQFLRVMGWKENVTLIARNELILDSFYLNLKEERICVRRCYVYDDPRSIALNGTGENPLVFFGTESDITQFVGNDTHLDEKFAANTILFVPLNGDVPLGLPEESFVVLPPHTLSGKNSHKIFPTPLLLEIAAPILSFAVEAKSSIAAHCNETAQKIGCMRTDPIDTLHLVPIISPKETLGALKILQLEEHFVYNIFKVESPLSNESFTNIYMKPFRKLYSYNLFFDNLTLLDESFEPPYYNNSEAPQEDKICTDLRKIGKEIFWNSLVTFRDVSWIYAFLSLSLLGVIFCVAILIFLLMAIFQRRVLEGNPSMTLLLLFAVMLLFCSILPFSIEPTKSTRKALCQVKALTITLSYAAVFSLLLSRSIVLSSAAKEIGFMSHIAGQVQSFLCLFIIGVQAALSLQVFGTCDGLFVKGLDFLYLMSYNTILLIILVCLTPLIYKSQRNYREGKYFTFAIILTGVVWCVWLPGFAILGSEWKEMMVCLGLVSTGAVCLGVIFIPRTYLMTIAAERDKITSALPSLTTATSAMDLYRAHPQPIYDCINIAAVNAATVARAGVTPSAPARTNLQQPDLYSCPALPEDIDFELCCDSPTNPDKVTRF
ncbi:uncharacterized protein boss [Euwallacea fornicatus]|uniref:uncharacterized protein boss n=1 Tax=Euwallacea fornicatus TaxID=995702 RepID=UPI00338D61E3